MLTILSQSTTDANRDRAWERLAARFPSSASSPTRVDWRAVRLSSELEIEDAIRVAGLARQKGSSIRGALEGLHRDRGRATLDHLQAMDDAAAMELLTGFAGVGVKTAACVLCFSLRRPVLPVDTHVHRIARRLGWIPESTTATKTHAELEARVAPSDRFQLHLQLITLGRRLCRARSPVCEECPLLGICPRRGVS